MADTQPKTDTGTWRTVDKPAAQDLIEVLRKSIKGTAMVQPIAAFFPLLKIYHSRIMGKLLISALGGSESFNQR